jgi:type IV pilus assembly protein PilE
MNQIQKGLPVRSFLEKSLSGFTLIELLVVIAIISVLSAVVLGNLNSARGKGANAAIKATLNNLRGQMEVYFDEPTLGNGFYGAIGTNAGLNNCTGSAASVFNSVSSPKINGMLVAANNAGAGEASCSAQPQGGPATSYAISVKLKVAEPNGNLFWCIDSRGISKSHLNTLSVVPTATSCP